MLSTFLRLVLLAAAISAVQPAFAAPVPGGSAAIRRAEAIQDEGGLLDDFVQKAGTTAARTWGAEWLGTEIGRRVLGSAISISATLTGAVLAWRLAGAAIGRYLRRVNGGDATGQCSARARTLLPLARNALQMVLVVLVGLILLSELGVDIAPLLAGAGIIGIAVGFGSQKLVQDIITGAFILFEDTICVGDVVKLDGHAGQVEAMSIRAIRLRDLNGSVHTIPFSAVGTVVNMTKDFSYAVLDVGVAYREDTDRVTEVLVALGEGMRLDEKYGPLILEPLEVMGVDRFEASAVVIRVRFKTLPLQQWKVTREFNRRMKKGFEECGIEIPFPHTTIHFAEDDRSRDRSAGRLQKAYSGGRTFSR